MAGNLPGESQQLSEREREILSLVAQGLSNQQIAHRLGISVNTVKVHLRNVFSKIGAASRTEASMYAVRAGIVPLDRTGAAGTPPPTDTTPPEEVANASAEAGLAASILSDQREVADHVHHSVDDAVTSTVVSAMAAAEQPAAPAAPQTSTSPSVAPPAPAHTPLRWWSLLFAATVVIALLVTGLIWTLNRSTAMTVQTEQPGGSTPMRWEMLPDMPEPRAAFAVATFEDRIYVVGGENTTGVLDSLLRFDVRSGTWTRLSAKPTAVADVHAVVLGGKLYIPGGRLSEDPTDITDRFERYDLRAEQWDTLPELPEPRSGYALATLDGKIYVIGGWDGTRYRNDVFEYDPERGSWLPRTEMPTTRAFAAVGIVEDRIFVLGGENEQGALANNEVYTPALEGKSPWSRRAPLPQPRTRFGATVALSSIILLGGDPNSAPAKYNVSTDNWEALEPPTAPIGVQPGVVLLNGKIYGMGGLLAAEQYSSQIQTYQAVYSQFLPR